MNNNENNDNILNSFDFNNNQTTNSINNNMHTNENQTNNINQPSQNTNQYNNTNEIQTQQNQNTNGFNNVNNEIQNQSINIKSEIQSQPVQEQNTNQYNTNTQNEDDLDDVQISYFDGTLLELLGYHFLAGFIISFTFGVFEPWAYCIVKKYIYSHTVYEGKRLKFDGDPEDLFVQRFKWIFFTIITLGIYLLWVPVRKKQWEISNVHFEDEPKNKENSYFVGSVLGLIGTNILCLFLLTISLGILSPLVYCIRLKWFLNNSVISNYYIDFQGKSFKLFLKWILWGFLTMITLGIFGFWIPIKLTKWEVENTGLIKNNETEA